MSGVGYGRPMYGPLRGATDQEWCDVAAQGGNPDEPHECGWHGTHTLHEHDEDCDDPPKCRDAMGVDVTFTTKDSGTRQEYESGMRRDIQEGKPRFDLIFPEAVKYEDQLLTRFAELLARGAEKYGENNWQLANSEEELKRFRASGLRHMIQWACGETDEDHATAVIFNLMAFENTKRKLEGS